MSDETSTGIASDADRVVEGLHRIDQKVDDLRNQRLNDPDSLGDKLVKSAVPALAGCGQAVSDSLGQGRRAPQCDQRTGCRRTARPGHELGICRHLSGIRRNSFAVVQSGLSSVCRATPPQGFSLSA